MRFKRKSTITLAEYDRKVEADQREQVARYIEENIQRQITSNVWSDPKYWK